MNEVNMRAGNTVAENAERSKLYSKANRFFWLMVTLIVITLSFFEWRSIHFQLDGERSVSPADLAFLVGSGLLYFFVGRSEGYLQPIRPALSMWRLLLPILLMFVFYDNHAAQVNVGVSLPRFTLAGLTVYLVIATLALQRVSMESLLNYVLGCALAVTAFTVFDFAFTRCFLWQPFQYGEGTPALHFPFDSTSQAALFMLINLILGIGATLALHRYCLLYFMIPILTIGIFQTSSRSLSFLLVIGLAGFYCLILLRGFLTNRFPGRDMTHIMLSTALAIVCLVSTLDSQGLRALSIFSYNPAEIASGNMDAYRSEVWKQVFGSGSSYVPRVAHGLHNAYLDLFLNWGILSFTSFLVFIALMLYSTVKLVWCNKNETNFPIFAALLSGLVVVVGAIYGNPLLQLKFVWIFFGLILSFQFNEVNKKWRNPVN